MATSQVLQTCEVIDFYCLFRYYSAMFGYKIMGNRLFVFFLLSLAVLAVFGRTIWFDYVQLDEGIILVNNWFFVSDISNFFEAFKHDINYPSNIAPYYRPMFIVSFILNSQFGSSPLVFHLGNILLHIIAAYLIFWLFLELGFKKEISFVSSLIFAIHPVVTPVVAWVPGRIEAILTIFTALSFIMFIRYLRIGNWRYVVGFFIFFTAALFTKEVVISLFPVLAFYYLIYRKEKLTKLMVRDVQQIPDTDRKRIWFWLIGSAAIVIFWFFVRKNVLAGAGIIDITFLQILSMLWSNSAAIILYLGKTILPFNLSVFPTLNGSTFIYGFVALIFLVAYWFTSRIKFSTLSALGLLWFVAFLTPSLVGLYPTEKMAFFEHRLYLPLVGIFIFFVGLPTFRHIDMSKYRYKLPITAVIILFSVLTFNYSGFYSDRLTFWGRAVIDSPLSPQAQKGLATAYLANGRVDEANERFARTLELNPQEKNVHLSLGLYYLGQGQYDKGKEELEKEIEIDPNQFIAHHSLGRVYAQKNNYKEAEKYFLKTIEISPDYVLVHQDLVVLYFVQNKHPQAIVQLKELLRIQKPEAMHPQILKILEIYAKESVLQ